MIEPQLVIAAVFTSAFSVMAVGRLLRPPRRLGARVRPYTIASRSALGLSADFTAPLEPGGMMGAVTGTFGPMIRATAAVVGRIVDSSSEEALALRLRQAGLFADLDEQDSVSAYRVRQLGSIAAWAVGTLVLGLMVGVSGLQGVAFVALGAVVGATRLRGRLERAIEDRRSRMRIEIYTINQLLAIRVRAGGGVLHAVSQVCERGRGEVVGELREALRLHRAGGKASDAFGRLAALTPEPYCARTYALLAVAEERGSDLAAALLSLSDDVREARREGIRRSATRRRAAMLIPTIAVLAPVMLLFVGAPLPSLLLGFR